jgi:hypothetical protein
MYFFQENKSWWCSTTRIDPLSMNKRLVVVSRTGLTRHLVTFWEEDNFLQFLFYNLLILLLHQILSEVLANFSNPQAGNLQFYLHHLASCINLSVSQRWASLLLVALLQKSSNNASSTTAFGRCASL